MSDDRNPTTAVDPEAGLGLWPAPPELKHMSGQFKLGYSQARDDGLEKIRPLRGLLRRWLELDGDNDDVSALIQDTREALNV